MSVTYDNVRIYNRPLSDSEVQQLYVYESTPPQSFLTNGLVAYYPFNGNANNAAGSGFNGTVYGAQVSTDRFGNPNSAYRFDGAGNYVYVADQLPDSQEFTLSVWIKSEEDKFAGIFYEAAYFTPVRDTILETWPGGELHGTATKIADPGSNSLIASGVITTGVWKHVVWTLRTNGTTIYVDGTSSASTNYLGNNIGYHSPMYIGAENHGLRVEYFFRGGIDDVRIYNRALGDQEVQELYSFESGSTLSPPAIITQPTNTSVVLGNSAAFHVQATGDAPLTYQWRKGGTNIGGATGTNYIIAATVASDAANYDVVVTNGFGSSIISAVAMLTILFPPTIAQPPQSHPIVIGSNTAFSVTASGTPVLSYQWRKDGLNIGGAMATNYNLTGVTTNDEAGYDVVVSNPYGSITSAVAVLTVVFPPSITVQPTNQTVVSGSIASFGVTAAGTEPLSYQWHNGTGLIPDATNSNVTVSPALTNNAGDYFVVVSNPYGQLTSAVATLTVFIPVSINTGPFSQLVAAYDTATFSVGAFGDPAPYYQWLFNGVDVPGANGSSLVITNVGTNDLGYYWVEVWNAYSSATSSPAALLMSPSLSEPFTGDTVIWGKAAVLSVAAWGSGNLSYQWFKDGAPLAWGTNATLEFSAVQISDGGLYSVVVSSEWGSVTNTPAQLVINPANISLGLYAGITIDGVPGYTYNIQSTSDLTDTNSWVTITNLTLTQPVEIWVDTSVNVHGSPRRFYRVSAP